MDDTRTGLKIQQQAFKNNWILKNSRQIAFEIKTKMQYDNDVGIKAKSHPVDICSISFQISASYTS